MAFEPDELIRLPQIPTELRAIVQIDTPADQEALDQAGYKKCYGAFVDGKVPAVRTGSGWGMYRRDLPALAAFFKLRLRDAEPSAAKPARAAKRASSLSNRGAAVAA